MDHGFHCEENFALQYAPELQQFTVNVCPQQPQGRHRPTNACPENYAPP
jgi:hypothetical protein